MADFVCHGAVGVGVSSGVARYFKAPRWIINLCAVYGFTLGAWPDAWDWVSAEFGWTARWSLYTIYHTTPPWYLIIQPPFFLHWLTDKAFHDPSRPGWNWWPEMGWLEIGMWTVAALLVWYAFWYAPSAPNLTSGERRR